MTPMTATASVNVEDVVIRAELNDEPSLAAQAAFAIDYANRVLNRGIISRGLYRSLNKLSQMLQDSNHPTDSSSSANLLLLGKDVNLEDIQLPPMELTMSCLRKLRCRFYTSRYELG